MKHKLKLIFGIAISFPLYADKAQRNEVIERICKPLVKALFAHDQIKCTVFITGHLLDWCAKYRQEYIQAFKELVSGKRIELLGGGYYDPIFPLIPREDGIAQIENTSTSISKMCRKRPRGMWINQLLWDPTLTNTLQKCGINYTFLRDIDCIDHNSEHGALSAPVITEYAGKSAVVFPINTHLCELWRRHKFGKIITELRTIYDNADRDVLNVVTLMDDAEERRSIGFIERFFQLLSNNIDWIETVCPATLPDNSLVMRTTHFHSEHLHTLKRDIGKKDEMSYIYTAMHHAHSLVSQLRGDKYKKRLAKDLLLQSQNYYSFMKQEGCVYSTQNQRKHAYELLIEAVRMVYKEIKTRPTIVNIDYDFDGVKEFLFQNEHITVNIHRQGGVITEFDLIQNKWNWIDMPTAERIPSRTLLRFGNRIQKSQLRNCAIDYLLPGNNSMYTFFNNKTHAYSLANHLYNLIKIDQEQSIIQLHAGTKLENGGQNATIDINKKFQFHNNTITISYQVQNNANSICKAMFATQLNISPSLRYFNDVSMEYTDVAAKTHVLSNNKSSMRLREITSIQVTSTQQRHQFNCNCAGSDILFLYRLRERKSITIIPCWNLLLGPQDSRSFQVIIDINRIRSNTAPRKDTGVAV